MYNGDKDFTLDGSSLLGLGFALFLVLFNKVFSISPRKAKPGAAQEFALSSFVSSGNLTSISLVPHQQSPSSIIFFLFPYFIMS